MDHSPFNRLPEELQFRIAFFVSLQSPAHPKISWDLSDFRLGCRQFAKLGAQILARESSINRRSVYRGITIDFTPRSLLVLEALTANSLLASKIVNVYLVKWHLGWIGKQSNEEVFKNFAIDVYGYGSSELNELQMRFSDRQIFFGDPKYLAKLVAVIDALPAKPTLKWIEAHTRPTEKQIKRRTRLHPVSPCPDLSWHNRQFDSFSLFVKQWTVLNNMKTSLCTIMQNVTHFHLKSDFWAGNEWNPGDHDMSMWSEIISSLNNVICFQCSAEYFTTTFEEVSWPQLRKFYMNGRWDDVDEDRYKPFMLRHRGTLEKIRLPYGSYGRRLFEFLKEAMRPNTTIIHKMTSGLESGRRFD